MATNELHRKHQTATTDHATAWAFVLGALSLLACGGSEDPVPGTGTPFDAGALGTLDSSVMTPGGGTTGGSAPSTGSSTGTGGSSTGSAGGTGMTTPMGGTSGDGGNANTGGGAMGGASTDSGPPGSKDAGADAGPGASTGGDAGSTMHMDLGQGDGKDVITIGDSYMSLLLTGIQQSLEKVSMRDYRNYAFPGTLVLNEQIPNQYLDAKREDADIKTVVMTGGGNDILTNSCSGNCMSIVDMVSVRFDKMLADMGKDGVQDVVLISYGYPSDQSRRASLDYSRMLLPTKCKKDSMPRCHFIDPVKELDGKISSDGIHPTDEGYDILGKMVWEKMKAEGIRR